MEVWKDIAGYEGRYEVSNCGRIRSLPVKSNTKWFGGKVLSLMKNQQGYALVNLSRKTFYVHRLVANAFIDNPHGFKCVNHKDEDKTNNNVSNLEWCSYKYNNNYGTRNIRISNNGGKRVKQIDLEGNIIKVWDSATKAAKHFNTGRQNICACCAGRQHTSCGYVWQYCDE